MRAWATVRLALQALRVNRVRSALTALGVIIGVAAVVTMVAVGAGAQARVAEQIRSLGSNLIVVISGTITATGVRLGGGSQLTITEDDARAIEREIDGVQVAAPTVRGGAQVVLASTNWATAVWGVTPGFLEARDWALATGRPLTAEDVEAAAKVALLGQTVVDMLFGEVDPIGQTIRVRKVPLTVVGVLARKGQNTLGQDQDDAILLPLSTAKLKVLGTSPANPRAVGSILVKVREAGAVDAVVDQLGPLLRERHRLQPEEDDDFTLRPLSEIVAGQEAATRVLGMLLAAIASVSLVVGGIGIMNIMLVSVTERTREIGLRRAVGARRRDILLQFLLEAATVSLAGGVVGIGLGIAASHALARLAGWPALIDVRAVVPAFAVSAAIGVFFGFYPARTAARLNPIDALRQE
jgi:putative ABC transport system permease protein